MGGESKDFTKRWQRLLKLSFPRCVNIGSHTTVNARVPAKKTGFRFVLVLLEISFLANYLIAGTLKLLEIR